MCIRDSREAPAAVLGVIAGHELLLGLREVERCAVGLRDAGGHVDQESDRLQEEDPRKASIVSLRFFAGLEREEIAELLGVSVRTVDREWKYCVARLHRELQGEGRSAHESGGPDVD